MRRFILVLLVASCTREHILVGDAPTSIVKLIPTSPDLDVLFMIDNSASTADKQTVFASDMPAFVAALDQFPGGRPNLHIGVVDSTLDLGVAEPGCPSPNTTDDGLLHHAAGLVGCTPPNGSFISDIAGPNGSASPRQTNYSGTLDQSLSCITPVGANGCGFEGQLGSIARALDNTHPENAGFLRDNSYLAVVILTDEDDCTTSDPGLFSLDPGKVGGLSDFRCQPLFAYTCDQPITPGPGSATYTSCKPRSGSYLTDIDALYQSLAKIKDPSLISVSLISGDPETTIMTGALTQGAQAEDPALLPSCSATIKGNPAIGRPGIRLKAFADEFAPNSSFASVCQSDYTSALTAATSTMQTMMTSPCLDGAVDPTDTGPSNPGVQPACTVVDRLDAAGSDRDLAMPACPMIAATLPDPNGPRPCWWAATDESCTPRGSELAMHIERSSPPPPGTVVAETCARVH